MKHLTWKINQQVSLALLAAIFGLSVDGQTVEAGKSYKLTVSVSRYSISDDHLFITSANINSKGLSGSYTNNDIQRKSIRVDFEYGDGNYYSNLVKETGFLIEYKNAYSVIKNKNSRWYNYTGYSIKTNSQFIRSEDQYSWVSMNALSFYNSLNYSWKRNTFTFDLSVPLIGIVSRPDTDKRYTGPVNEMLYHSLSDPVFTSFHNYKEVSISFQYLKSISNRLNFSLGIAYLNRNIMVKESSFKKQGCLFQSGLSLMFRESK